MMATVFDVAEYILSKLGEMPSTKLHKLVYYSQAWSLVWDETPLFDSDFEAWIGCPMCVDLWEEHKGIFVVDYGFFEYRANIEVLSDEQRETIDIVIREYGDKEPLWLSTLVRMERPWKMARIGVPVGERCHNIISKEDIKDYYSEIYEIGEARLQEETQRPCTPIESLECACKEMMAIRRGEIAPKKDWRAMFDDIEKTASLSETK